MKLKHSFLSLCCIIVLFFYPNNLCAQVTIGTDFAPNQGSLLDLKEKNSIGVNSTKGLGIPRVKLTKINDISQDIAGVDPSEARDHIGLLVYNTNENFCGNDPLARGMHVWDGEYWIYLGPEIKSPDVHEFIDRRDDERYLYRTFGNAGTWMLQNMRAKRWEGSSTDIPLHNGSNNHFDPMLAYPSYTKTGWTAPDPNRANEGILYNWIAATNLYFPGTMNQAQAIGNEMNEVERIGPNGPDSRGNRYVQGICPSGWHVPSVREWNLLEKELYENADKYSTYTSADLPFNPATWDDAWSNMLDDGYDRGSADSEKGHGFVMLNVCLWAGENGIVNNLKGKSFPAEYGGFNAYITGYVNSSTSASDISVFWTSSSRNGSSVSGINKGTGWVRGLFNAVIPNVTTVDHLSTNYETLIPVRCIKTE